MVNLDLLLTLLFFVHLIAVPALSTLLRWSRPLLRALLVWLCCLILVVGMRPYSLTRASKEYFRMSQLIIPILNSLSLSQPPFSFHIIALFISFLHITISSFLYFPLHFPHWSPNTLFSSLSPSQASFSKSSSFLASLYILLSIFLSSTSLSFPLYNFLTTSHTGHPHPLQLSATITTF